MRLITYAEAISEALVQGMERDPRIFIMGLGVDDWKGIFGTTLAAAKRFGPKRVFDVPASEGALTGIAIGCCLNGKRPIVIHARNDFMFLTLDQLINNAAKWKYVCAGKSSIPIVVRGIIGRGWGQGPTHSQSIQSLLVHFPGLSVAMPSSPFDVKGILLKSFSVDHPVIILEHRQLYDLKGDVPEDPYLIAFGQAKIVRQGRDCTVVATSIMVQQALEAADYLSREGIELEIVDPITLKPLDEETILQSVKKTGRLICADTSWRSCGFAAEILALAAEKAYDYLKSPLRRVTLPECPCPVSQVLEEAFYPTAKDIVRQVEELLGRKSDEELARKEDSFAGPY